MTEHNTSFGGLAVADPRSADDLSPDFVDETENDNKRKLAVVGAIVGVVVLLIAAFFLLKGGGSNTAAPLPPHVVPPASSTGSHAAAATHTKKAVALPKTYKAPIGRDPFKALYTPAAPKAASTGTAASNSTGTSTPTVSVPTTGGNPGTVTAGSGGPSPVWVELVGVNGTKSATFVVGYNEGGSLKTTHYTNVVAPSGKTPTGTVFAGDFALLSIQNGSVTVQFGDATPFDLKNGFADRRFVN